MVKPDVLYEDTHILVLAKPAGLLSQGDHTGQTNIVDWARRHLGRNYVGLVHRLDRNVSGIMIIGKRTKAAKRLTQALQKRTLRRTYLAWLEGTFPPPHREPIIWEHYLLKNRANNTVTRSSPDNPEARRSVLSLSVIGSGVFEGIPLTCARIRLETGRSHQIRVQTSLEGHPVLGDPKYGKARTSLYRPALHSHEMTFPHPMSGGLLTFRAPVPDDLPKSLRGMVTD